MPIYDAQCEEHGEFTDVWAGIEEDPPCPECGNPMCKLIGPSNINPDWEPYVEHNMGHEPVHIKSRQHYYEERKKRKLVPRSDTRG